MRGRARICRENTAKSCCCRAARHPITARRVVQKRKRSTCAEGQRPRRESLSSGAFRRRAAPRRRRGDAPRRMTRSAPARRPRRRRRHHVVGVRHRMADPAELEDPVRERRRLLGVELDAEVNQLARGLDRQLLEHRAEADEARGVVVGASVARRLERGREARAGLGLLAGDHAVDRHARRRASRRARRPPPRPRASPSRRRSPAPRPGSSAASGESTTVTRAAPPSSCLPSCEWATLDRIDPARPSAASIIARRYEPAPSRQRPALAHRDLPAAREPAVAHRAEAADRRDHRVAAAGLDHLGGAGQDRLVVDLPRGDDAELAGVARGRDRQRDLAQRVHRIEAADVLDLAHAGDLAALAQERGAHGRGAEGVEIGAGDEQRARGDRVERVRREVGRPLLPRQDDEARRRARPRPRRG